MQKLTARVIKHIRKFTTQNNPNKNGKQRLPKFIRKYHKLKALIRQSFYPDFEIVQAVSAQLSQLHISLF
ncbi:MAG: hypothetical protein EAZ85_13345 [Bacteroidetes bacterium]|nr:MAG: hypothetical protein EAZ85_13345 [Bacteroidota bacterium]TAG92090.1 MAG: hypothetical protein EAZ20_02815 [Bacteroidota bacterium]